MHHVARVVAVAAVAVCSLLLGMRLQPQEPAAKSNAAERHEAVQLIMKQAGAAREHGLLVPWERAAEIETRVLWSRRLADAAVDAGAQPAREAYTQHVARTEVLLREAKELLDAGRSSVIDVALARYHVADAKALLERAK